MDAEDTIGNCRDFVKVFPFGGIHARKKRRCGPAKEDLTACFGSRFTDPPGCKRVVAAEAAALLYREGPGKLFPYFDLVLHQ